MNALDQMSLLENISSFSGMRTPFGTGALLPRKMARYGTAIYNI